MQVTKSGTIEWKGGPDELCKVIGSPVRWRMIEELARQGWLPVGYLAGRAGVKGPAASAHIKILKKAGVLETGVGRLYRLAAALRPEPGAEFLDLGPCRIRLRPSAPNEGTPPNQTGGGTVSGNQAYRVS